MRERLFNEFIEKLTLIHHVSLSAAYGSEADLDRAILSGHMVDGVGFNAPNKGRTFQYYELVFCDNSLQRSLSGKPVDPFWDGWLIRVY
jgi:hypothetical protein